MVFKIKDLVKNVERWITLRIVENYPALHIRHIY